MWLLGGHSQFTGILLYENRTVYIVLFTGDDVTLDTGEICIMPLEARLEAVFSTGYTVRTVNLNVPKHM